MVIITLLSIFLLITGFFIVICSDATLIGNLVLLTGVLLFGINNYMKYKKQKNGLQYFYLEELNLYGDVPIKDTERMWIYGEVYSYVKDKEDIASKKACILRVVYSACLAVILYVFSIFFINNNVYGLLCCVAIVIYIHLISHLTIWEVTYKKSKNNRNIQISDILKNDTFEEKGKVKNRISIIASISVLMFAAVIFTASYMNVSYTIEKVDGGYAIESCRASFSGEVEIPSEIDGKTIVSISEGAFEGDLFLKSVILPDTITTIESRAFKDCTVLESVKLPENLKTLNGEAFMNCRNLQSIFIPVGVTEIRGNTFEGCSALTYVSLHDGITDIHAYAFKGCSSLGNIDLPTGITEIHANTFEECTSLLRIVIPDGVTRIAAHAFYGCSSLSTVGIPDSLEEIGSSAFRLCSSLYDITLPEGVIVNDRAFKESPTQIGYRKSKNSATDDSYSGGSSYYPDSDFEYPIISFYPIFTLSPEFYE